MDYLQPQVQQSLDPRNYQTIICVFGSRGWNDKRTFHHHLTEYLKDIEGPVLFLSGGAHDGPDNMIIQWCKRYGYPCMIMYADWDAFGKGAGFIRNTAMSKILTRALGFWDGRSRGTKHMQEQCVEQGHPVRMVSVHYRDNLQEQAHREGAKQLYSE